MHLPQTASDRSTLLLLWLRRTKNRMQFTPRTGFKKLYSAFRSVAAPQHPLLHLWGLHRDYTTIFEQAPLHPCGTKTQLHDPQLDQFCGFWTANIMNRDLRVRWKFCSPMAAVRSRSSCSSHHLYDRGGSQSSCTWTGKLAFNTLHAHMLHELQHHASAPIPFTVHLQSSVVIPKPMAWNHALVRVCIASATPIPPPPLAVPLRGNNCTLDKSCSRTHHSL
jgi:hypothetical protein